MRKVCIFLMSIFMFLVLAQKTYANESYDYFDTFFENDSFTIYTDAEIDNQSVFDNVIVQTLNYLRIYNYSSNEYHDYLLRNVNCSFTTKICDFILVDNSTINGEYQYNELKTYSNIHIIINNDIGNYFNMINKDDNIIINYPESFFENDDQKYNFISDHIRSFNSFSNHNSYEFYYSSQYIISSLKENINNSNLPRKILIKKYNSVIFDYQEEDFSDKYKEFSNGSVVIYSDFQIDESTFRTYLSGFNNYVNNVYSYSYVLKGDIKNDVAFVELQKRKKTTNEIISTEGHIINILYSSEGVEEHFEFADNDKLTINYPESFFNDQSEKYNYVSRYISSFSNLPSLYYSANIVYSQNVYYILACKESYNNEIKYYFKKINNVVFDYQEAEYSDDFKKFSNGSITIESDFEFDNTNFLYHYLDLYRINDNDYNVWFNTISNIKNNKVIIEMIKNDYKTGNKLTESHIININYKNDFDLDVFEDAGLAEKLEIKADVSNYDVSRYISSYFSNIYQYHPDYSYNFIKIDDNNACVIYKKNGDNDNKILFHKIPIIFTNYSSMSEEYEKLIGSELIIHGDSISYEIINKHLWNGASLTNLVPKLVYCDYNYNYCDILVNNDYMIIPEVHKVKITLDTSLTNDFINEFKIQDNIINMYVSDLNTIKDSFGFYSNEDSYEGSNYIYKRKGYDCNFEKCILSLEKNNLYEEHEVSVNFIISDKSDYYKSQVRDSTDIYFGDTPYDNIAGLDYYNGINHYFAKNNNDIGLFLIKCDSSYDKCSIGLINDNNDVEIHYSTINKISGMSDEFKKLLSDGKVKLKLKSINRNDFDFDYSVFVTQNRTISFNVISLSYDLDGYSMHYYLESHKIDLEYSDYDSNIAKKVNETISKIGDSVKFEFDDLDYLNYFYYQPSDFDDDFTEMKTNNYNSAKINDSLSEKVLDNNIKFLLDTRLGDGDAYYQLRGGNLIVLYNGIAYDRIYSEVLFKNIIYIPDDTGESIEDYLAAGQKRIDDYFGKNSGVVLKFDHYATNNEMNFAFPNSTSAPINNSDGYVFRLDYGKYNNCVFLIKNSSKIQSKKFKAYDVYNNVFVSSNDSNLPNDTVVDTNIIDTNSNVYSELLNKIGIDKAFIIDINLYSKAIGRIKDFNNSEFEVFLNLDLSMFNSRDLYAYYINGDNVEEHKITIGEFFSSFKTNHFSTYIIGEKIDEKVSLMQSFISKGYKVTNSFIHGFKLEDLLSNIKQLVGVNFTSSNTVITTGTEFKYNDETITAVIYGDLNGDGKINSADLLKMRQHLLGTNVLNGAYKEAASIATGTTINSADLLRIRQHLLGTKLIEQ